MKLGLLTYDIVRDWDLGTLISQATALGFDGVSFRVDRGHAHGVELSLTPAQRHAVREVVEAAGLDVCGLSSGCRYDSLDGQELRTQIEHTKDLLRLAADIGAPGVKVFGNNFHEEQGVGREVTIAQIAAALKECAQFGAEWGVEVRFDAWRPGPLAVFGGGDGAGRRAQREPHLQQRSP
jgi:sugar phosphate isomerase/epimerase